ncbi:MAG TPA: FtsX-like permease family protein, partial [Acidimicrobiales bacterium]|nr:FtsX-like permease family protein [Acidimicrobiales bacterium]
VAIPGSISTVDLRDQAPGGTFNGVTLRLDSGRYPTAADEVAVTSAAAKLFDLRIGSSWAANGRSRRVVGIVENPLDLLDAFALVPPGQAAPAATVSILTGTWQPPRGGGFRLPSGTGMAVASRGQPSTAAVGALVLALGTIGLLFVGLMAVAGFTVMAQRRQRALGMLAALGATDKHVRLVMLADGAAVGMAGAAAGAIAGLVAWVAFVPTLQSLSGHRIDRFALPWWAVAAMLALAVLTAIAAAWWPARGVARTSIVAALSGRPSRPQPAHRFAAVGAVVLAAGLALLWFSDHESRHQRALFIIAGTLLTPVGFLFLAPLAIRLLAAAATRFGVAVRLALRDLVRYQARSGAALGSVTLAIGIAATIAVSASAGDVPTAAGNLPPDQLMFHAVPAEVSDQVPPLSPSQVDAVTAKLDDLARAIGARAVVPLEQPYSVTAGLQPPHPGPGGQTIPAGYAVASLARVTVLDHGLEVSDMDPLYVATPSLLSHYGIAPSAIDPATDVLSARTDLAGLQVFAPEGRRDEPTPTSSPDGGSSPAPKISAVTPRIQSFPQLPLFTSAPGILLTTGALQRMGLSSTPGAWLVEAAGPLTSEQIRTAQAAASSVGLYVESKKEHASLAPLRLWSTAVGVLLALGVLGMTVGLIRSETAGDLRTLAATGASRTTRRTITAATSGALALLAALLGTAGAYAALLVWYRSDLSPLGRVPWINLVVILAGLPLLAAAGGWLLAGREPPAIARQPLE